MSAYVELGKALGSLLVGGFVGSASNDFYQSYRADCDNNHHTPILDRIIGAISLVSVVNLTKYLVSFVQKKSVK